MRSIWKAVTVLACAATILGGAVGSAASANQPTAGSKKHRPKATAVAAVKKATGAPIVVGSICSCSGAEATVFGGVSTILNAWAKYTNDHGGINGHPVKMIVLDDGDVPATAQADAQQLVEQDHVVAIVGPESLQDTLWAPYVEQQGVPVIGGESHDIPYTTNADFFPSGGALAAELYGVLGTARSSGKHRFGMFVCNVGSVCGSQVTLFKNLASIVGGIDVTFSTGISETQPDFTAPCLAAKSANVDSIYIASGPPTLSRVAAACKQQGFNPKYVEINGAISADSAKDPNLSGLVAVEQNPPLSDNSVPGMKLFHTVMKQYAKGFESSPLYGELVTGSWAGAQLFAAAATAGHIGPHSTSADVKKGLYALKKETLGGLTAPLTFTPGQPTFVPCFWIQGIGSHGFTEPSGARALCIPKEKVAAVKAAMGLK